MEIVTRWFGVFAVEAGKVVQARPFPADPAAIKARWQTRWNGDLTVEEKGLWADLCKAGTEPPLTRDRRFQPLGARPSFTYLPRISPRDHGIDPGLEKQILLDIGLDRLKGALDPSLQLCEAVRAMSDLEGAANLMGERLVNWWVDEDPSDESRVGEAAASVAKRILAEPSTAPIPLARRSIASQVLEMTRVMAEFETAVTQEAEDSLPNLSLVLGPMLAARVVAQAGGLARLSKMPASTLQVLGAEKAFFDHLRTGNPPPKYGLIFIHPAVLGAPAAHKGKMARTLAAKAAIAARRDITHAPALPALKEAVDKRLSSFRRH